MEFLGAPDLQDFLRKHPAIVSDRYHYLFSTIATEGIGDETEETRRLLAPARERLRVLRRAIDSAATATTLPTDIRGATTFQRVVAGASPRRVHA
jgi:hypothetical protein